MTTNRLLSLFISSKMQELAEERRAVQAALKEYEERLFQESLTAPRPLGGGVVVGNLP